MLSQFFIAFLLIFTLCNTTIQFECEYNSTTYPIDAEWTLFDSCQTCKCLSNKIIICRNRTCQMPTDCPMSEQLTLQAGSCCPKCSPIRRSCLYENTAILHNTVFYPKSCLQCRCRDGQLFCDDICRQSILQNKCSFDNELYEINKIWSPLPCVICQCREISTNQNLSSVCYIKQCPTINNCLGSLEFIPGQCCPVCQTKICRDTNGVIYQNGDVWTKDNICVHCTCRDGSIVCSEEICPNLQCRANEKVIRLPNSCCAICSNRHVCRFYGNNGYQVYYEYDIWYTSACQYCTCRRHNRIVCKSIQCEHQFCLEDEIQESKSDSCCVSCRKAQQCDINGHIIKEGSYQHIDNCTICTCTLERQPECYSNCKQNGYVAISLPTSGLHRNHTITVTDSLATIIAYSKSGTIVPSSQSHSLLFQFSSSITTKSNAAVLLGIIHNSTGQISYRLILIDFDSTLNNTKHNQSLSDELRLWMPITVSTQRPIRSSITLIEEDKNYDQIILILLIILLSFICFVLVLIIVFLCYRRQQKSIETGIYQNNFKRENSSVSIVEKFHAPDLTTKVTLLTHFHISDDDLGTDV
ncbi:unnamed protein product [Rotaria magnacalcarata]|uniref:VWFC domain-containing protein n=3 Tax=Rotaria magnacalcarata TaxID=392030 RepID=A0A816LF98_9BILA|nr:unnamed protein product [Rotaria magnacalcarata]CAF1654617.1 unnamed protein product [Rotaria magnacalcarata]CAF1935909.1 unnamed protein product [Rotaria magnacalcarata]CAF2050426.1 unnamed protein product [Rotaria magnacalcarata]CAF2094886.1 unnamed protein product [Rotaria magnacalcarata]